MNVKESPFPLPRRLARMILACGLGAAAALAQSAGTGRITGRVFNPATQEYVRNAEVTVGGTDIVAFSDADGSYVLPNVPAGAVTLAVAYTGYERATAALTVAAGATATRDFELKGAVFALGVSGRAGAPRPGEVVTLEKFVVSNEREGNAKAIMEQRAALNMKSVVAADNFGDVTGGNVGEFVKYLPGVVLDYVDADARAVRLGGLDPKYAAVSVDGMRMASAASATFGGTSRQFEFEQSSITSIESIEINKTLTASMDADAPAGAMNLRSKNAFERRGREITFTTTLTANPYELTTRRTPGPGDGEHRKIRPGFVFTYADSFRQRFGVQLSLSHNSLFNEQAASRTRSTPAPSPRRARRSSTPSRFATTRRSPRAPPSASTSTGKSSRPRRLPAHAGLALRRRDQRPPGDFPRQHRRLRSGHDAHEPRRASHGQHQYAPGDRHRPQPQVERHLDLHAQARVQARRPPAHARRRLLAQPHPLRGSPHRLLGHDQQPPHPHGLGRDAQQPARGRLAAPPDRRPPVERHRELQPRRPQRQQHRHRRAHRPQPGVAGLL